MKYYPVFLDIKKRECLVVGGGAVALRKVRGLLGSGAGVTAVSPDFVEGFEDLPAEAEFKAVRRSYRSGDLDGKFLVIGATDDSELNMKISRDAESRNILCNIADVPEACSFILPSVVRRGDLVIAISTSGKSPAFSKHLRKQLEKQFGSEYEEFLSLMGAVRKKLLAEAHAPEAHKPLFEALISGGLHEMIGQGRKDEADKLLKQVLGPGFGLESLIKDQEQ